MIINIVIIITCNKTSFITHFSFPKIYLNKLNKLFLSLEVLPYDFETFNDEFDIHFDEWI